MVSRDAMKSRVIPEQHASLSRTQGGDAPSGANNRVTKGGSWPRFTFENIVRASANAASSCDRLPSVARRANAAMQNLLLRYRYSKPVATIAKLTIAASIMF